MPIRRLMKALRKASGIPDGTTPSTPETSVIETLEAPSASSQEKSVPKTASEFELILYGRPSCPYCARVDRVIKELNIEDKITRRHTGIGTEWRADLRKRTGSTQVPCLFIDGEPMFESLDIIAWMKANLVS